MHCEIPVLDGSSWPVGVVTDRYIVCRIVAEGKNPLDYTAESCMTTPIVTVSDDAPLDDDISIMEAHQIRRIPVVDGDGCCAGIIAQADLSAVGPPGKAAEVLWEVSRERPPQVKKDPFVQRAIARGDSR